METRINRILDETRRIPKALGRRGWTALAVVAAPLMYLAAAIQLAPAQTVEAPALPAPPAPRTAPIVTMAQAQAAPVAPPSPPVIEQQPNDAVEKLLEEERQLTEMERRLQGREAALQAVAIESAQIQAERAQGQGDLENKILDLNREIAEMQAQVAQAAQAMRQVQVAQSQAPPPQGRVELFNPTGAGAPVQVDVKTVRTTVISIPLDPTQQYELICAKLRSVTRCRTGFCRTSPAFRKL